MVIFEEKNMFKVIPAHNLPVCDLTPVTLLPLFLKFFSIKIIFFCKKNRIYIAKGII